MNDRLSDQVNILVGYWYRKSSKNNHPSIQKKGTEENNIQTDFLKLE